MGSRPDGATRTHTHRCIGGVGDRSAALAGKTGGLGVPVRINTAVSLLLLLLAPLTPTAVAGRCAGESQTAVNLCACTVRHRLEAGWAEAKVLTAYYARSRTPTAEQVQQASDGLAGIGCIGTEFYLFSKADMRSLRMIESCAVASGGGVWAFKRDALGVCRGN